MYKYLYKLLIIFSLIIHNCTTDTTGTGSETDIGTLTAGIYGFIVNSNGTPVEGATIISVSISDSNNSVPIDTVHTDSNGFYNIITLPSGNYYLEGSLSIDTATYKTIIDSIYYDENLYDSVGLNLGIDTLKLPGFIKGSVSIHKNDKSEILVYIPGTTYIAYTDSLGNFLISNIPADSNYTIVYSYPGYLKESDTSIKVKPNDTTFLSLKKLSFDPQQTPPPPTDLSAILDTTNRIIHLNWSELQHPGLAGFILYRKDSTNTATEPINISGNSLIPPTATSFSDSLNLPLAPGDTIVLQYQIKSQHIETGNKSDLSNPTFVRVFYKKSYYGKMVLIQSRGLSFSRGLKRAKEPIDTNAQPVHEVSFTYDFYIDTTEATQKEYASLMTGIYGYNNHEMPSWDNIYGLGDNYPSYYVNWFDAILYCNALSKSEGLDTVYTYSEITYPTKLGPGSGALLSDLKSNMDRYGYRLPTEAEWEFACRSGSTNDFYWKKDYSPYPSTVQDSLEIDNYATWAHNSGKLEKSNTFYGTHEVGTKSPNDFGLYDMSGNLMEYCNDFYDPNEYDKGNIVDPTGPTSGTFKVMRGGYWRYNSYLLRSAHRNFTTPSNESSDFGFRTCLLKKP